MKKTLVAILFLVYICSCVILLMGCTPPQIESLPAYKTLREKGTIRIAVAPGIPGFCQEDPKTGQLQGFEIDIAHQISTRVFEDENAAEIIPLDAKQCGPKLEAGDVDIIIAAFGITEAREAKFGFTRPYFTDHLTLLVKKGTIALFGQVSGKVIGYIAGSGTDALVKQEATQYTDMMFDTIPYASYPEAKDALTQGKIDALCARWVILRAYADISTSIIEDRFAPQQYAIACIKSDNDLLKLMDTLMADFEKSGLIKELIDKWGIEDIAAR
jgi:aspartate/glutamate/glutamine transport system substrate-binding protein